MAGRHLVGALPALLVGFAMLIVYRPLSPRSAIPRFGAYLVPIGLFELYRLLNLGSVSAYASWWGRQGGSIGYQVGVDPSQGGRFEPAARGPIDRVADQVRLLAERAGLPTGLVVALFVGVVALSGVLIVRIIRGRDRSRRLVAVASVQAMLLTLSSAYLVWWTLLVPEPKTFVRRTYPILLGLYLALVVLAHLAAEHREQQPRPGRDRLRLVPGAVLATVVALLVLSGSVVDARRAVRQDRDRVAGYEQAAAAVSGADPSITFYGTGFFSAPLVSLLADRSFHNLGQVDPCALDPDRSVLVWDEYAQMEFGSPEHAGLEAIDYELGAAFAAVSLWRIEPPDSCVDPEPAG